MKNALQYYYHLTVQDIHQNSGIYKFTMDKQYYAFYPYDGDLNAVDQIYDLSVRLLEQGVYCHQIVLNVEQKIVTMVNGVAYILLRSAYALEEKITVEHLIAFAHMTENVQYSESMRHDNWQALWSEKIDYFEYQVNQFGKSHPLIRESFSYFVGLAETGISLLSQAGQDYKRLVVSHKRIQRTQTLFDLYNPMMFIIDLRVRDVCEYFKESFVRNKDIWADIEFYLTQNPLSSYEYFMFFVRMFYPSFYFDLYEEIIGHNREEELLAPIIALAPQYELLLKRLYLFLSRFIALPEIEWLKKV